MSDATKTRPSLRRLSAGQSLRAHWPVYLIEAAALGLFMVSAGAFSTLMDSPGSFAAGAIVSPLLRRIVIGVAMGGTAMALIYSPWGKRSGAHMNPAITLTYLRLGEIPLWDAFYYSCFQLIGGVSGVVLTALILKTQFTAAPVRYVVTVPGPTGPVAALICEAAISAAIMLMILLLSNSKRAMGYTGIVAGIMIAGYVICESPISGFGMNPARSLASALPSGIWTGMWIYLLAPTLGMLAAAQGYLLLKGPHSVACCKLHHSSKEHCIYCGRTSLKVKGRIT